MHDRTEINVGDKMDIEKLVWMQNVHFLEHGKKQTLIYARKLYSMSTFQRLRDW